jgi:choline/glycine/proline betaine transport protein
MAMIGGTAIVLLLAGGLSALQTAAIASALPFSLAILAAIWGFARALSVDHARRVMLEAHMPAASLVHSSWRQRIDALLTYPDAAEVRQFILATVVPAMRTFADELRGHGQDVEVVLDEAAPHATLEFAHGRDVGFYYRIVSREIDRPEVDTADGAGTYWRAEVVLREGNQGYDIMGWNEAQILQDMLTQYERHLEAGIG